MSVEDRWDLNTRLKINKDGVCMIVDSLKNSDKYIGVHDGFKESFEFLKKATNENLPAGRYEIDGDRVFAFIQEYSSKSDSTFEGHKNYIDIQYIFSGTEVIKFADILNMKSMVQYDAEKDIQFFENYSDASIAVLKSGEYGIFFPWDIHKPGLRYGSLPSEVKKIVVKVKY